MSPTGSLRTWMLTFPAISTLATSIAPPPLTPNSVMPCITIQTITARELESMTGESGMLRAIAQITCYSDDIEVADQLRRAVKDSLLGQMNVTITGSDYYMAAINHNGDRNLWDDKIRKHVAIVDLQIWWDHV